MSDSFQSYVFGEAKVHDGRADFRRVTAYLVGEQIIGEETADNVLGGGVGHVPGSRAASILIKDNANWRSLTTRGVAIRTGRIIEASNEWESGTCPNCRVHIAIDTESEDCKPIYEALDAYHEGRGEEVECPKCGTRTKLSDWDFGHGLALGSAMVQFWNWPRHVDGLTVSLADVSGLKCTKVWGKL
ncbi:hypothetical protein [Rhizobium sp. LjRoot254]|uniref:hypothetical protein n=1 Tax=Rhizobium sp. LjRoot254 TaxID=3342297 RepID=UPI003ECEA483